MAALTINYYATVLCIPAFITPIHTVLQDKVVFQIYRAQRSLKGQSPRWTRQVRRSRISPLVITSEGRAG